MTRAPFLLALLLLAAPASAADPAADSKGVEFFEAKVHPALVEHCLKCHSAADGKLKGGLALDTRAGWQKGGDSGPAVVPGKPADSLLLKALRHDDLGMPPDRKLPAAVVADFEKWVALGAPDPRTGEAKKAAAIDVEAGRKLWAYRPPVKAPSPAVKDAAWPAGDTDRFVLAALEAKGLRPAADADKRTLLRRLTYDLTGLPPTPEELDAFVKDDSPTAYPKVVDRLLASPQFGVRWARHWLDGVRYADEDRGAAGPARLVTAPYRDWVVDAFNRDLPYDQFVRLQVAGHLLPPEPGRATNADNLTATGLWGMGVLAEVTEMERERAYADHVDDQIDLLGRAFLGTTLACARCHDHKFDPITQRDYYALAGIFASSRAIAGRLARVTEPVFRTPAEADRHREDREKLAASEAKLAELEKAKAKTTPEYAEVKKERDRLKTAVQNVPTRLVVQEGPIPNSRQGAIGDAALLVRGDYRNPGPKVPRGFPEVMSPPGGKPLATAESGRRELAEWLTRPEHPLTARVMANRVWQQLFGWGIVRSSGNFGKLGDPPTHPELLDHLAVRFVESGWSVKALVREVVLSRAYRQASVNPATEAADPDNRLLGRANRRRLDAEQLRDTLLLLAGAVKRDAAGDQLPGSGRSLYERASRTRENGDGLLPLFDGAAPNSIVTHRGESTSAPQALFMLNNPVVAKAASKVTAGLTGTDEERIAGAYRAVFGRTPTPDETALGREFAGKARGPAGKPDPKAWVGYVHVLLCLNEFVYLD